MAFAVTGITTSPAILAGESELVVPGENEIVGINAYHPPVEATRSHRTSSPKTRSLKGLKLLHVDDQPIILATVKPLLKELGLNVTSMTDPREALCLLKSGEKFDLLVLDFRMPELDGVTLYNELVDAGVILPVLFFSGSQGSRQAAMVMSDLDRQSQRGEIPIAFQKKEAGDLLEAFRIKLTRLASLRLATEPAELEKTFPQLRSAFDGDDMVSELRDSSKVVYRELCEAMCDTIFGIRMAFAELDQEALNLEEVASQYLKLIKEDFKTLPTLEEMLLWDYPTWHTFKGNVASWAGLGRSWERKGPHVKDIGKEMEIFSARVMHAFEVAYTIGSLFFIKEEKIEISLLRSLKGWFSVSQRDLLGKEIDLPEDLKLSLPQNMMQGILITLMQNAQQALPMGAKPPTVIARIETEDGQEFFYLGVRNVAAERLSEENRLKMLQGESFTTKPLGSSSGLALIRQYLQKTSGSLRVVAQDDFTEVGILIPIK